MAAAEDRIEMMIEGEAEQWAAALARAALLGAAEDLAGADPKRLARLRASGSRRSRCLAKELERNARHAEAWLAGAQWSRAPLTLARCCAWLDLEAEPVAQAILADPAGVLRRARAEGLLRQPGR